MKHSERGHKRMYLIFYLRIFEGDDFLGFVIDISQTGVMILSEAPMSQGRIYALRMKLPPDMRNSGNREYLEFNAACKWSRPDEDNKEFFLNGFEMENLSEHTRALIAKTIDSYRLP